MFHESLKKLVDEILFAPSPLSCLGFPCGSAGKESTCSGEDLGLIPGLGRSPREGIVYPLQCSLASLVAQMVKNVPAMQETWVWFLGWEDLLKEMAIYSNILAWKIPGAWQATVCGVARVGHDLAMIKWQPTPVFLPGESQGWRSLVGCHLCKELDTTEVT